MTIKSLNTKYAGCLFRSRLEARWAVMFNHLPLAWEYEPQGFEVEERMSGGGGAFNYLPDFWFSDLDAWGEVKGSLTHDEMLRLLNAAGSLSSPAGGCGGGHDLIVFGPVTSGVVSGTPIRLHLHKGDLIASCWACEPHSGRVIARDDGTIMEANLERTLLLGYACAQHYLHKDYVPAIDAARTARFEHGARPKAIRR